ncbi:MAG: Hvo_1808 family surface protein [Haloferacaceae archaeon]
MRRALTLAVAVLIVTTLFAPAVAAAPPGAADPTASPDVGEPTALQSVGSPTATDGDARPSANELRGVSTGGAASTEENGTAEPTEEGDFGDGPVGRVEGYWYNDSIEVDQTDGLDEEEMEAYVSRSMARVEHIRDRKFREDVPVDVMTREEFREMQESRESGEAFNRWNDQVWKALFVLGENESSEEEIQTTLGGSVAGFYSPADDEIVIVTEDGGDPVIDNSTLVHELNHAMQDQYHNLSAPTYRGATQDADLAVDGVVEGESVYVERQYEQRCESGEWDCVATPSSGSGGDGSEPNLGIFLTIFQPYSDGPGYVADIYDEEGWEGVAERMENPPQSSAQVIHRTDREPVPIEYEDTATRGWEPYPDQGVDGAETVGEASIYAMFWYQARFYEADTIDWRAFGQASHPYETYNYVSEPSSGWANDELYPYRRGADEDGYVWVTEWQTERDAEQFRDAYGEILETHDVQREDGYHVVEDGPFRGTYLLSTDGTRVTIVHGPSPEAVSQIRPGLAEEMRAEETTTETTDRPEATDRPDTETPTPADEPSSPGGTQTEPADIETPGFGAIAALAALLAVAALFRRRR